MRPQKLGSPQLSSGSLLSPLENPAAEQPGPCSGLQDKLGGLLSPSRGSLLGTGPHGPGAAVLPTPALGTGITSPSLLGTEWLHIPSQRRGQLGEQPWGAHSQVSQLGIVGRAQALLLTGPVALFPFPEVWGGRRNLLQAQILGFCSSNTVVSEDGAGDARGRVVGNDNIPVVLWDGFCGCSSPLSSSLFLLWDGFRASSSPMSSSFPPVG